ncbi:Protein valois [Lucilia cuprina]|uniref:Protein valois n=1 Tax=Lucilia cuprina TaxID=7375 RepID=A0A0L0BLS5_LUCCU|nr:Protein valois [Lucilia cuprina]KNC21075.1 Protein valois [Lucilia cuprina]
MLPLTYGAIYKTPDDYNPPQETDLADNTHYPNLNSRDYAKRPLNQNVRMYGAWECIAISTKCDDEKGNIAIATNKLSGRNWLGSLWAFEKSQVKNDKNSMDMSTACYKLESPAIINCIKFVEPNTLLLGFNSGRLQLWSIQSDVCLPKNPYCPFLTGDECEHMKPITCLTGFKTNVHKAATGSKDGVLKIWDMGKGDLNPQQSYSYAHMDSITGLTSSPTNDAIFTTCSLDKSCLLWDDRETRPAIALYNEHNVRFKTVNWALDPQDNCVYLGDESGNVLTIDTRKPKELLNKTQYFDRPIRKISPNGENLAVVADSNCIKVAKSCSNEIFYENNKSQHFIRDCAWLTSDELVTVGYEGKLRGHEIQ